MSHKSQADDVERLRYHVIYPFVFGIKRSSDGVWVKDGKALPFIKANIYFVNPRTSPRVSGRCSATHTFPYPDLKPVLDGTRLFPRVVTPALKEVESRATLKGIM